MMRALTSSSSPSSNQGRGPILQSSASSKNTQECLAVDLMHQSSQLRTYHRPSYVVCIRRSAWRHSMRGLHRQESRPVPETSASVVSYVVRHSHVLGGGTGQPFMKPCSRKRARFTACHAAAPTNLAESGPLTSDWDSNQMALGGDLPKLIQAIPFRRVAIWGAVGIVMFQLSEFFGLVMGTFIISFIGNSLVDSAAGSSGPLAVLPPPARRRALALLYFAGILATVTLLVVVTVPGIAAEGADFVKRLQSDNIWVVLVEKMRKGLGDQVMDSIEKAIYLASNNDITAVAANDPGTWTSERIASLGLAISSTLKAYTTTAAKITASMLSSVTKLAVQTMVSLVLGFMLVWDMPSIKQGVSTLGSSRLAPVYNEVAPVLTVFGRLFGKALKVQARIALINTALTALGMWLLQIPGLAILSLFVFVCSFIPIAGCILSTVPIGFVALTEYGFFKLAMVICMVIFVHFVEAYFLNPAIYSAHLKLHPLLVLSVLVVAEHSIGVWGLLLAVPLTVFMLDYCIRYPESSIHEVGKKELQVVLASMGEEDEGRDLRADEEVSKVVSRQLAVRAEGPQAEDKQTTTDAAK
ncbi:hypothetical protein CEUSTIGMA_g7824.t1 [Chlamydomonas eustigma]|uniref:AI-2E family transporter n=1 Tax=Chlamydomonas eustigma TaxID=1157962 RepID=A0A250XBB3_9CHLO|nr:hypothetical protein CEUSTIGMA_g7824.t1 [Chlamydomonas eustigma]|eukprot:GAX80385.1 hypothetical protein CEUSTIGMA_g7824.t1 [Chlamydomonas eustigma]